jgi:hypothetical protein
MKVTDEKSKIRIRRSVVRTEDLDPDSSQNVTDPQHWKKLALCGTSKGWGGGGRNVTVHVYKWS